MQEANVFTECEGRNQKFASLIFSWPGWTAPADYSLKQCPLAATGFNVTAEVIESKVFTLI